MILFWVAVYLLGFLGAYGLTKGQLVNDCRSKNAKWGTWDECGCWFMGLLSFAGVFAVFPSSSISDTYFCLIVPEELRRN